MSNIICAKLPETLRIDGVEYPIYTNFRSWYKFAEMMDDERYMPEEKMERAFSWFKINRLPENIPEAWNALTSFLLCEYGMEKPKRAHRNGSGKTVFSWKIDAPYVLSAFRQVYGIDLRTAEMHWYEFRALFDGLPEDTPLKQRIMYRGIKVSTIKDKNERERIIKIQKSIAL